MACSEAGVAVKAILPVVSDAVKALGVIGCVLSVGDVFYSLFTKSQNREEADSKCSELKEYIKTLE